MVAGKENVRSDKEILSKGNITVCLLVVSIGAGIKEWSEYSEKAGRSRQNVLKRYLDKIEKENRKIRKRKKYRKVTHFVFEENSVLTFQLKNGRYAATLYSLKSSKMEAISRKFL